MPIQFGFDRLPLWAVFFGTVALIFASIEAGRRWGAAGRRKAESQPEAPVGAMVGAVLGLLAFMLAFTFGMAGSRFEARREVVLDEANAIGTTYLRASLLAQPHARIVQKLLKEYVDLRIAGPTMTPALLKAALDRSVEIHDLLWAEAVAAGQENPGSITTGLFIQSLNELIDLHSKRVMVSLRSPIPRVIWTALYALAAFSMALMGYHAGVTGVRRSAATLLLAAAFSAVVALIADLERPQQGLVRVSQQALIDARAGMSGTKD